MTTTETERFCTRSSVEGGPDGCERAGYLGQAGARGSGAEGVMGGYSRGGGREMGVAKWGRSTSRSRYGVPEKNSFKDPNLEWNVGIHDLNSAK